MKRNLSILLILFLTIILTGCVAGIKSEDSKTKIIENISNGLKINNYNELENTLEKYDNSMFDLVGDEDFSVKLHECIKKEYKNAEDKDKFYNNVDSLLTFLEEHSYKDSEFRNKMYKIFINDESNIVEKLDLYKKFNNTSFYKKEMITKQDIDDYIKSSAQETINEKGKGGYYDEPSNKTLKSQGKHYEGWHTKSSSVGYSGDFAYEYIYDEYVDNTYYEIHHNDHYEIYYKGTKLNTTINKIPKKSYYAAPYLFIELDNKIYILKVDGETYGTILYTYPESN